MNWDPAPPVPPSFPIEERFASAAAAAAASARASSRRTEMLEVIVDGVLKEFWSDSYGGRRRRFIVRSGI
jgi:hypothetical protein